MYIKAEKFTYHNNHNNDDDATYALYTHITTHTRKPLQKTNDINNETNNLGMNMMRAEGERQTHDDDNDEKLNNLMHFIQIQSFVAISYNMMMRYNKITLFFSSYTVRKSICGHECGSEATKIVFLLFSFYYGIRFTSDDDDYYDFFFLFVQKKDNLYVQNVGQVGDSCQKDEKM